MSITMKYQLDTSYIDDTPNAFLYQTLIFNTLLAICGVSLIQMGLDRLSI